MKKVLTAVLTAIFTLPLGAIPYCARKFSGPAPHVTSPEHFEKAKAMFAGELPE